MKRKVLHLVGSFNVGGTERQAIQLARLLANEGSYEVFIGCLDADGPLGDEASMISAERVPEYKLSSFYDLNFWNQVRRCMRFIKEKDIGIIHTHDFYTNFFGMLTGFLAGVPVRIASKRNTSSKTANQQLLERQAFRAAHKILVNADAIRKALIEKGVDASKLVRSFNGVDLDRFVLRPASHRSERLKQLGLDHFDGKRLVSIVANLRSEVKNHRMFLRTAAEISKKYANAVFVLAGEGELEPPLRSYADELGLGDKTVFLGRCDDVPGLLSVSDVCLLTSTTEGFPNAILEYMAAEKPVVATDVGGSSEVVIEGRTGFLVPSDDSEAAADRVAKLLADPDLAKNMGREGRRLVEQRYSLRSQMNQVKGLYDALPAREEALGVSV